MPNPKIVYILPSYSHFNYARTTLLSLHEHSPFVHAIIVDDASRDWNDDWYMNSGGGFTVHRFEQHGGLTRSWNRGLRMARAMNPDYIVAGNNDVLFTPNWWVPMCHALDNGYSLVGPLTNAPGDGKLHKPQNVREHLPEYRLTDDRCRIDETSRQLLAKYGNQVQDNWINGFFMMAKANDWVDKVNGVFPQIIDRNPSGRINPTPTMTGQEYWLQWRWEQMGRKSGIVLGSFIFHYRSVSRGTKYACRGWWRRKG